MDDNYVFLHMGKYTLALNRGIDYPTSNALTELHLMYTAFVTFYGGFDTAFDHTTKKLNNKNVDREKASSWCIIRSMVLNQPTDPGHVVDALSSGSLPSSLSGSPIIRQLSRRLSLIFESVSSCDNVLGSLSLHKLDVVMSHNLNCYFIQFLKILIQSNQMEEFGDRLVFDVNNVVAYRCYLKDGHILLNSPEDSDSSFYVIVHIKGDLSLTLIIRSSPLRELLYKLWRRPCIRLKDELFKLYNIMSSENSRTGRGPATSPSTDHLLLRESASAPVLSIHSASLGTEALPKGRRNPTNIDSQGRNDILLFSIHAASEALCEGADIASVTMTHASGYSVWSVSNNGQLTFTGSVVKQTND